MDEEPQQWERIKVDQERRTAEDLLNEAILHVDISMEGLVIVHDPPAFDQKPVALQRKSWERGWGNKKRENVSIPFPFQQRYKEKEMREHLLCQSLPVL